MMKENFPLVSEKFRIEDRKPYKAIVKASGKKVTLNSEQVFLYVQWKTYYSIYSRLINREDRKPEYEFALRKCQEYEYCLTQELGL